MKLYKHASKNLTAEVIEFTPDNNVVLKIRETGETRHTTTLSFKRWWSEIEDQAAKADEARDLIGDLDEPDLDELDSPESVQEPEDQEAPTEPTAGLDEPEDNSETSDTPESENSPGEVLGLSEVILKLEELFDLLNGLYFDDELVRPVITVQSTPRAYGHCSTKQIWASETESRYEINIGAEFLNQPSENTAATMCHEMVHLFCRQNDIEETCQKGRYHNKLFKAEAESRDLEIGYDRAIGYSLTSPTEAFKQKLTDAGFEMTVPFARHTITKKATASRAKAHKYVCPECGQAVRSTSDLHLICGDCNVELERQD